MPRALIAGALILAACSSSSTPPQADGPGTDLPRIDQGPKSEARVDAPARDLGKDGPKAPAVWKTIAGAPVASAATATLLQNGDVLIVGGFDGNGSERAEAVRYLAAQAQFVPAGQLATARVRHTASRLPDGRVLIAGGDGATILQSTEIFDPSKPAASAWSAGPDLLQKSSRHAATTLADGKVLLTGGWSFGVESSTFIQTYDPASGSWLLQTAMLAEARRNHTSTLLKNGKVLLAGGIQGTSTDTYKWIYLDSLEVYDPATGQTKLLAVKMSKQRWGHSAGLLADGRVLIVGGRCWNQCKPTAQSVDDLYDPATDTLVPLAHPGEFPSHHAATLLDDGRLLVIGGELTDGSLVYAFQPAAPPSWSKQPSLGFGRIYATATKLLDGTVLVVGGRDPNQPGMATTAERFIP